MRKPRGYWKNYSNLKFEVLELVNKIGAENLTYKYLSQNGYNNLMCAMQRMSLTLGDIYKDLGLEINWTPKGYYQDINNVLYELQELINIYGCIPPREVFIQEKKSQLEQAIYKFHGGAKKVYALLDYQKESLSALEILVKKILNSLIDDSNFVDNGRKNLKDYGLNLQNPETKMWFELDRYYFKAKIAIEIQGQQHYRTGGNDFWSQERTNSVVRLDLIKKKMLDEQGIYLITIPYNRCSRKEIYDQLKQCGMLKLREFGETLEEDNTEPSLEGNFLEGVETSAEANA